MTRLFSKMDNNKLGKLKESELMSKTAKQCWPKKTLEM